MNTTAKFGKNTVANTVAKCPIEVRLVTTDAVVSNIKRNTEKTNKKVCICYFSHLPIY